MLKTRHKIAAAAAIAGAVALGMAAPATAEIQNIKIKAVGTWANLTNYYDFEKPFYGGDMTKASGGKIQTQIRIDPEIFPHRKGSLDEPLDSEISVHHSN